MNRHKTLLALVHAGVLVGAVPVPVEAADFPSEVHGSYAPNGQCEGYWRVQVHPEMIEFHDEVGDSLRLSLWDICYSCAGGGRDGGAELWAMPRIDGTDKVPVFRFNAGNQPGRLEIDYHGQSRFDDFLPRLQAAMDRAPLSRCE